MEQLRFGLCNSECMAADAVARALDCVLKKYPDAPVREDWLLKELRAAIETQLRPLHSRNAVRQVVVSVQNELLSVPVAAIRYIEGDGHHQLMYLEDRQEPVPISSKMQTLEEELASEGFLRIHHGYLVNGLFVGRIGTEEVLMTGGERLPISRGRRAGLKSRCLELRRKYGDILL